MAKNTSLKWRGANVSPHGLLMRLTPWLQARRKTFCATLEALFAFVLNRRTERMLAGRLVRICWGRFLALTSVALSFAYFALDPILMAGDPRNSPAFTEFVRQITHFGSSGWVLIPIGVFLIFVGFLDWKALRGRELAAWTNRSQVAWFVFVSVGGSGLIATVLKQAIGRARPVLFDQHGIAYFNSWSFEYSYASFPSGHATTAAAFCTALALLFPRLRIAAAAVLLWTTASRCLIQVHYPSDVVAGAALGIWFSYFVAGQFAKSGLLFNITAQNDLVPKRGLFLTNCNIERTLNRKFRMFDGGTRKGGKSISLNVSSTR